MNFPFEIIGAAASGLLGFLFKVQANSVEALRATLELQAKAGMTADQLANSASERSSPTARKILAYIIVGTFVLGLFAMGLLSVWNDTAIVSVFSEAPPKDLLWGMFKWGGGQVVTEARGFVLPSWTGWVISVVVGFFFGTGAAKPSK